jgi:Ca2+-binding EF-hand superfamily protein
MNKRIWLTISAICTFGGVSVAAAHGGGAKRFEKLDKDQDGVVTSQEFEAEALAHFSEADSNQDGRISAEEREARHEARKREHFEKRDENGNGLLERAELERMPEHLFTRLDTDKNGALSPEELANHGGPKHRGHRPKGVGVDADQDGVVTQAEFVAKARERMARLDADQDGKLSQDEFKAHKRGKGNKHGHHCGGKPDRD